MLAVVPHLLVHERELVPFAQVEHEVDVGRENGRQLHDRPVRNARLGGRLEERAADLTGRAGRAGLIVERHDARVIAVAGAGDAERVECVQLAGDLDDVAPVVAHDDLVAGLQQAQALAGGVELHDRGELVGVEALAPEEAIEGVAATDLE